MKERLWRGYFVYHTTLSQGLTRFFQREVPFFVEEKQNLTIDDIARQLNVSKTTVSRAISGKGRISAQTRERVLAYIEACNYRPSAAAKGLAEHRTYNLALVLPREFARLDLPFIRRSMSAICAEAALRDYNILLCLASDQDPAPLIRILDNRKADGVILTRTAENDALIDQIARRGVPFATMGSLPPHTHGLAAVEADSDQVSGCCAFTAALLRAYPEKTALLGGDMRYIVNQRRLEGVRNALAAENPDFSIHTGLSPDGCGEALDALLEQGVRQFLCMDDDICMAAVRYLEAKGLAIPEDVRLASLYDSDELSSCKPPIPALRFDAEELGRITCRELLRCLQGEPYDAVLKLGYRVRLR